MYRKLTEFRDILLISVQDTNCKCVTSNTELFLLRLVIDTINLYQSVLKYK